MNNSLLPIYPNSDEFVTMLEELEEEEMGQYGEKKRRLRVDQVKALEKNFEVENKLEPERKVRLAKELGLQPRQVAVWFQNRRARWKTKQLERDFGILKSNYDSLKLDYDSLNHNNQSLIKQIKEMKAKLKDQKPEDITMAASSGEEAIKENEQLPAAISLTAAETNDLNFQSFTNHINGGVSIFPDFKDGSSDSDSSVVFNEANNQNGVVSMNCFNLQFVKMEEENLFEGDESRDFFWDDQTPMLHWYNYGDQWN